MIKFVKTNTFQWRLRNIIIGSNSAIIKLIYDNVKAKYDLRIMINLKYFIYVYNEIIDKSIHTSLA